MNAKRMAPRSPEEEENYQETIQYAKMLWYRKSEAEREALIDREAFVDRWMDENYITLEEDRKIYFDMIQGQEDEQ